MDTIQPIELKYGELYNTIDGRQFTLATYKPTIELRETTRKQRLRSGGHEFTVRSYSAALIMCTDMKFRRNDVGFEYLEQVSSFDTDIDILMPDGSTLRKSLYNITPVDINLNGAWKFNISGYLDELRQLFPELRIWK